jgi:hypothetical protein
LFLVGGLALCLLLVGCTTAKEEMKLRVYGSVPLPRDAAVIRLGVAHPIPKFKIEAIASKGEVAGATFAAFRHSGDQLEGLAAPVAFVELTVFGLAFGLSKNEIDGAAQAISAVLQRCLVGERLAEAVAKRISAVSSAQIVVATESAPISLRVPGSPAEAEPSQAVSHPENPAWRRASSRGPADILIHVHVRFQGFCEVHEANSDPIKVADAWNPRLSLEIAAYISVTRASDGKELGGVTIAYASEPQRYRSWVSDGARPLSQAFESFFAEIGGCLGEAIDLEPPATVENN